MKLFIFLLFTTLTFAQPELMILMGNEAGYDNSETTLYASALTTALSDTQMTNIDEFISMVKDSLGITNLSDAFDVMYLFANETNEASFKNLVKRSHDADSNGTVTFTAWQGWAGNGSTGYINTDYNQSTGAVTALQNLNSCGIYSRTNSAAAVFDIGVAVGVIKTQLYIRYTDNHSYSYLNSLAYLDYASASDSRGFFVLNRKLETHFEYYVNGDSVASMDGASSVFADDEIFIGSSNSDTTPTTFSTRQYAFAFFGKGLTKIEARKLNNCVETYLDGIGAGVE